MAITKQKQAYYFATLAVVFWGTIGAAFKLSLQYLTFNELLVFSSFISIVVLLFVLIIQKKTSLICHSSKKDILHSALLGLFNPFLYYFVLLQAYNMLQAQEAAALNYIWPIVLTILSIPLLKQKIGWLNFVAIFISFSGTLVIATKGNFESLKFENPLGVALALGSAIFWALFWIFNVKDQRDEVVKLFLNLAFGFVYACIAYLITADYKIPQWQGIVGAIYIGIFEMGITFVFWLKALKLSSTTAKVTNLIFLAPFLSLIIISFAVGEKIMYSTIIGLVLIVTGIIVQNLFTNRSKTSQTLRSN